MNRFISSVKNSLIQMAFEQCVPKTDLTFCFNYCHQIQPVKLKLKSIQDKSKQQQQQPESKKYKIDTSTSSKSSNRSFIKVNKLKYSKVTIRIGNNRISSNKQFIRNKQVNKLNSNIKVITITML